MKIAIASCLQESNNFSPVATTYDDFNPVFGPAVLDRHRGKLTEMGGFLDVLETTEAKTEAITVAPICAAWAITANRRPPVWQGVCASNDKAARIEAGLAL